jgi:hypothetical protein
MVLSEGSKENKRNETFSTKCCEKDFSRWSVGVGSRSSAHANRSKRARANSLVQIDQSKIIVKYSLCV